MTNVAGLDITCGRAELGVFCAETGRLVLRCGVALPVRFCGVCESSSSALMAACGRLLAAAEELDAASVYAVCDERSVLAVDAQMRPLTDVVWAQDVRSVRERDSLTRASFTLMHRRPSATLAVCKALWVAQELPEVFAHTAQFVSPARLFAQLARGHAPLAASGDRYMAAAAALRLMPEVAALVADRLMLWSAVPRSGQFDADPFDGNWRLSARLPTDDARDSAFYIRARIEETGGVRQINAAMTDPETCRLIADIADATVLRTPADACLLGAGLLAARSIGADTGVFTAGESREFAPVCPSHWDIPYIAYCVAHAGGA